jgi:hypothetical protein
MRVAGFVMFALMATVYLLLSMGAEGLLAGFGYLFSALLYILAVMNLIRPRK